jgi:hypothetical protein
MDWEFDETTLSPVAMYSLPSVPKWMEPPLCCTAEPSWFRSIRTRSLPATATSPSAVNRLTRLCGTGVGVV